MAERERQSQDNFNAQGGKRTKYLTQLAMMPQHPGGNDSAGFEQTMTGSYNDEESGSQGLVMISLDQQERRTGGPNFQVMTDRSSQEAHQR